jgi:hypothetical protein
VKKNIEELAEGIFLVKEYISKDTAKFLIDAVSPHLIETPREHIYGDLMGESLSPPDSVGTYKDIIDYNVSIDVYNGLLSSINTLVSEKFQSPHKVKSYFFSCMESGAINEMHMDNHHKDENGEIHVRTKYISNKSGLLYLNDDYEGGELVFPEQGLSIKPETGSLIFFEGDYKKPHGVNKVIFGPRYNLVTFYEPVN